jgi:glutaredoxin
MSQSPTKALAPRRINGLFVLVIIMAGLVLANYRPPVAHVYCDENTLTSRTDVIMLGTGWCPYCYEARRYFENNKVNYCEYDIEKSPVGQKLYNDVNGQSIPILLIGPYRISGFDETRFEQLMSRLESER